MPPPQRCRFILLCSAISCHIVLKCHFVHHNAEPGASPASHSRAHCAWASALGEAQMVPASTPGSGDAGKTGRGEPDPKTQPLKVQACVLGAGIEVQHWFVPSPVPSTEQSDAHSRTGVCNLQDYWQLCQDTSLQRDKSLPSSSADLSEHPI